MNKEQIQNEIAKHRENLLNLTERYFVLKQEISVREIEISMLTRQIEAVRATLGYMNYLLQANMAPTVNLEDTLSSINRGKNESV